MVEGSAGCCGDCYIAEAVDIFHYCGFLPPVGFVILGDAQGVDPEVVNA